MAKLVIGIGTGRCGTRSLNEMLNSHPEIESRHEKRCMLWMVDIAKARVYLKKYLSENGKPIKSDIGYYWLNYTDYLVEAYNAKIICLKRNREDVVNSYLSGTKTPVFGNLVMGAIQKIEMPLRYSDYVTKDDLEKMDSSTREFVLHYWDEPLLSDNMLKEYFPQYEIKDRKTYLEQYWNSYYSDAEKYQKQYRNNFMIIDMDKAFNTKQGQKEIFKFIGVAPVAGTFHVKQNPMFKAAIQ